MIGWLDVYAHAGTGTKPCRTQARWAGLPSRPSCSRCQTIGAKRQVRALLLPDWRTYLKCTRPACCAGLVFNGLVFTPVDGRTSQVTHQALMYLLHRSCMPEVLLGAARCATCAGLMMTRWHAHQKCAAYLPAACRMYPWRVPSRQAPQWRPSRRDGEPKQHAFACCVWGAGLSEPRHGLRQPGTGGGCKQGASAPS